MEIICRGIPVCHGSVLGPARVIGSDIMNNLETIRKEEILVLPRSNPVYSLFILQASGIICEIGGRLSHLCNIASELGTPCITQADGATRVLKNGQPILLDATNGCVYAVA